MARLMEDLENKEDFEEFEMRQKSEHAAKILQEKKFEGDQSDQDGDENDEDRGRSKNRSHRFLDESRDDDSDDDISRAGLEGYTSDPEFRVGEIDKKLSTDFSK